MIAALTKAQWRVVSMLAAGEVIDSACGRAPFVLRNEGRCILPSTFRRLRQRGYLTLLTVPHRADRLATLGPGPVPHPAWFYCLSKLGQNRFESGEVAVL